MILKIAVLATSARGNLVGRAVHAIADTSACTARLRRELASAFLHSIDEIFDSGYRTTSRNSPCGGAVGPASVRVSARRTSPTQPSGRFPEPTSMSVPAIA